ncbi:MAG: hypothetical protein KAI72_09260, partial [Candidatus Pacebacteria bacterium]|nr:hypothetical protein [Candidatus Paceibacterota bacterium]
PASGSVVVQSSGGGGGGGGGGYVAPVSKPVLAMEDLSMKIKFLEEDKILLISNFTNTNVDQMAMSLTSRFENILWEDYTQERIFYVDPGMDTIYFKFRTDKEVESNIIKKEIKRIPSGTLAKLKNDHKIYIIKDNYKRHILSPKIFGFYSHFDWNNIEILTKDQFNSYQDAWLVRELNDYKVYEINGDKTKHHLNITAKKFKETGRSWNMIYIINKKEVESYGLGVDVE